MIERTLWDGSRVPALGLGCWAIGGPFYSGDVPLGWGVVDDRESIAAIRRGIELGVRFFDTASAYGAGHSERVLGEAIDRRDDVVVCTKVGSTFDEVSKQIGPADMTPAGIERSVEGSLRRLRRERIELLLLHVNTMAIEEAALVFEAFDRLRAAGKVGAYGWSTDFPDRAAAFADHPNFVAIEHGMNIFFPASDILPVIEANKLLSLNRSPLAMGLLTGKFAASGAVPRDDIRAGNHHWLDYYKDGRVVPAYARQLEAVRDLLQTGGRTSAQGAIAWLWARSPNTVPLPGFRDPRQVEENAGALEKGPLSAATMAEIERVILREPEGAPRER